MKIGFIGLEAMGGRLAAQLGGVGELTVFDASERAMEPFVGRALLGSSIAEAGIDADVVGVRVRTGAKVDDCVEALLPVMKRGSVLMIHSTVNPDNVKAAARRAEPRKITVIDAPVTVTRYGTADAPFVCALVQIIVAEEAFRPEIARSLGSPVHSTLFFHQEKSFHDHQRDGTLFCG